MRYEFKFHKILAVKEREKDEAVSIYQDSVRKFEEVAEKLYELLKGKRILKYISPNAYMGDYLFKKFVITNSSLVISKR